MLEGAIVFPFLLALALGAFEFSSVFFQHQVISAGLRDAARFAARLDPTDSDVQLAAQQLATTATTDGTGAPRLDWWIWSDVQITVTPTANPLDADGNRPYRGGDFIETVQVRTVATFPTLGLFSYFGLGPVTMTLTHRERVIHE